MTRLPPSPQAKAAARAILRELAPESVLVAGNRQLVDALAAEGVVAHAVEARIDSITQASTHGHSLLLAVGPLLQACGDPASDALSNSDVRSAVGSLCAQFTDLVFCSEQPLQRAQSRTPDEWAELFAREGFLSDLEFDGSFLGPDVVRYRRSREPLHRVVRAYERARAALTRENAELQRANRDLHAQLRSSNERLEAAWARVRDAQTAWQELTASRSWRLTRPLRAARRIRDSRLFRRMWDRGGERGQLARYRHWVRSYDTLTTALRVQISRQQRGWPNPVKISVLMPVHDPSPAFLRAAIASVQAQTYPHWELCIADDASQDPRIRQILEDATRKDARVRVVFRESFGHISAATNSALALASGEFVAFLDHDDVLAPHALFCVAKELREHPETGLVYSDEDKLDRRGRRCEPHFKPDWNLGLLSSYNYVCHFLTVRTDLVRSVGGLREGFEGAQDHDLVLRCSERLRADQILHVPLILYHWRKSPGSMAADPAAKPYALPAAIRAVQEHCERRGIAAEVSESPLQPGTLRVQHEVSEPPLVSLIVLTRDRVGLLKRCVESVENQTTYAPYELLIVDNGSQDSETLDYLSALDSSGRARVLRSPGPFNYSALNNQAVHHARGEILVLLNNDTEVLRPGWLTELVSHALQPDVGAVGCKLNYPDGRLQHAGVILGIGGVAGHAHKRAEPSERGYMARICVTQDLSAVTAACLAVRRSVYLEAGGFDETGLRVAFGDVDFCLKVQRLGYRNVYTPFAELCHHESASRGLDLSGPNQARFAGETRCMLERWGEQLRRDPAYSPNLTLKTNDFDLARPPRASLAQVVRSQ